MKYYILMSDIIGSGEKPQKRLMEDFKKLINEMNVSFQSDILSPLTITLGDEFQGIIKDLSKSVEIILSLEERIIHKGLNFKLRYILHQGEIETPINHKIAHEMLGPGLTEARFKLNDLKNEKNRFTFSIDDKPQNEILTDAFRIFDHITAKWDVGKDYKIVSNFILFSDYKIVSDKLNRNRSLLWKREKTLNMQSYISIKNIIRTIPLMYIK